MHRGIMCSMTKRKLVGYRKRGGSWTVAPPQELGKVLGTGHRAAELLSHRLGTTAALSSSSVICKRYCSHLYLIPEKSETWGGEAFFRASPMCP